MNATICVLAVDGVGPEVTSEAVRLLKAVARKSGHGFSFEYSLIGGAAIDATGVALPGHTKRALSTCDAVLLGAVGGPRWSDPSAPVRPEQGLFDLRQTMGAFANLRPVAPHRALFDASPLKAEVLDNVDLLFVRELTGGLYFGEKSLRADNGGGERATDTCTYTTREIERVARLAGTLARARRRKVTSVDKANVLETSRLWRRTVTRLFRDEFPDVSVEHALVDSFAMNLLRAPAAFDVVVTENLFGDILTDEAAVLAGSIGVLPSASFGERRADGRLPGIYEPIHGSAPDIAGTGVANPIGAILSAALLLRHSLDLAREADQLERAVHDTLSAGYRTADLMAGNAGSQPVHVCTTRQMGDAVEERFNAAH
jgi:3-isopropylmalate dehydrogenase